MSLIELRQRALENAGLYIGTREVWGKNAGPMVNEFLKAVSLRPGNPYCMAFVYHCYQVAADELGIANPLYKTGKVVRQWQKTPERWLSGRPAKGSIFIHLKNPDDPNTEGHCGFVEGVANGNLVTVEANTNPPNLEGVRDGDGVHRRYDRPARAGGYIFGFINIGAEGPEELPRVT